MEHTNLIALLTLAFGLGIVHALDADHIIAVTGLASTRANHSDSIRFCLRWAIGHALSLITIGICVFWLGTAVPQSLSNYAEHTIGFVLILVGGMILVDLWRKRAHLHFHQHDGLPQHAHWHTHYHKQHQQKPERTGDKRLDSEFHKKTPHHHHHSAVIVGVLHGTAGSAPLLVLVPLAKLGSAIYGIFYLLTFSIGVLIAMLVFGGIIGSVYQWLANWGTQSVRLFRLTIAMGTILFGGYMLVGS